MDKKVRLNLEFDPSIHAQMLKVQARTHAASVTETIRRAINAYDYLTQAEEITVRIDGKEVKVKIV